MKYFFSFCIIGCLLLLNMHSAWAQTITPPAISPNTASQSAVQTKKQLRQVLLSINEITNPEQDKQKNAILKQLYQKRDAAHLNLINIAPFTIQYAITAGVPT